MDTIESNYRSLVDHTTPRKNVLLLSCMDLRLLDNLVAFMDFENLENRYDQFILAGAAAGANAVPAWRQAFLDHLALAVALHEIKYVYIIEHRDCGAYEQFLGVKYVHYDAKAGHNCYHLDQEHDDHREQAFRLKREIDAYCARRRQSPWLDPSEPVAGAYRDIIHRTRGANPDLDSLRALWNIEVRCYLMNLRGAVEWLDVYEESSRHGSKAAGTPSPRARSRKKPTGPG